jgi:hypothetical protein
MRMDLQDVDEVIAILDMQSDYKTAQESFHEQQSKENAS